MADMSARMSRRSSATGTALSAIAPTVTPTSTAASAVTPRSRPRHSCAPASSTGMRAMVASGAGSSRSRGEARSSTAATIRAWKARSIPPSAPKQVDRRCW